jgi:hypothetical protein
MEVVLAHPIMMMIFGADYESFVQYLKCVSFGGEFFEEFDLTTGLYHGGMSWRTPLVASAKRIPKI